MELGLFCYRMEGEPGSEAILVCMCREDVPKEWTFEL